jgi:hypothetical protein
MTSDRKQPGVAFWTTIVVVVPVLYVLSFGPACWISSRRPVGTGETSARSAKIVSIAYRPMMWTYDISPKFIRRGITWYSGVGSDPWWGWTKADIWANLIDTDSIAKED